MPYWYQLLHQQCGCHIVWCTGKHKLSVGKYRLLHLIVFFRSASINLQVHMYRCSSSGVPPCVLSLGSVPVNKVITHTHHDQLCWAEVCLLSNHIMSINGTSLVLYSQLCTHTMSRQSQVAAELCFLVILQRKWQATCQTCTTCKTLCTQSFWFKDAMIKLSRARIWNWNLLLKLLVWMYTLRLAGGVCYPQIFILCSTCNYLGECVQLESHNYAGQNHRKSSTNNFIVIMRFLMS